MHTPSIWRHRPARPFRLSVRMLMILVAVTGGGGGWLVHVARSRHAAVDLIKATGGYVQYAYQFNPTAWKGSRWWLDPAHRLFGRWFDECCFPVLAVQIWEPRDPGWRDALPYLPGLAHIQASHAGITDADLAAIGRVRSLVWLELDANPRITDAGLAHLAGLDRLVILSLAETNVAGPGLAPLAPLPALEQVGLAGTPVTDAGLRPIALLRRLESLDLFGTRITDAGLAHLVGPGGPRHLVLGGGAVTGDGLRFLAEQADPPAITLDGAWRVAGPDELDALRNLPPGSTWDAAVAVVDPGWAASHAKPIGR